jgi:hypothetical protein
MKFSLREESVEAIKLITQVFLMWVLLFVILALSLNVRFLWLYLTHVGFF